MVITDPLNSNAKRLTFGSMPVQLCGIQQGLCGDAAFVQAGAAQRPFLKQTNLHAALCSPLGAQIAAGAATQD